MTYHGAHGVEVVRDYGGVGSIQCYPGDVNQMLLHVVRNALDAMPAGGALKVQTARRGPMVIVRVSDTGHGISEARLEHIFEPRFTRTASRIGAGLGLFTCYHVAKRHGGKIGITSAVGEGTTVEIELPVAGVDDRGNVGEGIA